MLTKASFHRVSREDGGIGRRAGFRFQWGNSRGGSSPLLRTVQFGQTSKSQVRSRAPCRFKSCFSRFARLSLTRAEINVVRHVRGLGEDQKWTLPVRRACNAGFRWCRSWRERHGMQRRQKTERSRSPSGYIDVLNVITGVITGRPIGPDKPRHESERFVICSSSSRELFVICSSSSAAG